MWFEGGSEGETHVAGRVRVPPDMLCFPVVRRLLQILAISDSPVISFFEVCARCGDGSVNVLIISVEAVLVNEPFHCHCRRDKSVNSPLLCDDIGDEVWFCEPESVLLPQPGGSFFSNISGYLLFC